MNSEKLLKDALDWMGQEMKRYHQLYKASGERQVMHPFPLIYRERRDLLRKIRRKIIMAAAQEKP